MIEIEARNLNENKKNLYKDIMTSGIPPKDISSGLYYFGLHQLLNIYDDFTEVISSLYEPAKEENGIRNLKRVYKTIGRRYNELALTINRMIWKPVF